MPKLYVAGCSFSDQIESNQTSWGKELAKKLNYDYVHHGAGCGSNFRIWRTITTAIIQNKLTSKDLLCVQYTNNDRKEFWSDSKHEEDPRELKQDYWDNGSLIRFKEGAWSWSAPYDTEIQFLKLYEQHFCNPRYNDSIFAINNLMFQCLLKEYKIPTIFCFTRYKNIDEVNMLDHFKNWVFTENYKFRKKKNFWLTQDDSWHMNDEGHRNFANQVYLHLQTLTF